MRFAIIVMVSAGRRRVTEDESLSARCQRACCYSRGSGALRADAVPVLVCQWAVEALLGAKGEAHVCEGWNDK